MQIDELMKAIDSFPLPKRVWIGFTPLVSADIVYKLIDNEREAVFVLNTEHREFFDSVPGWDELRNRREPLNFGP